MQNKRLNIICQSTPPRGNKDAGGLIGSDAGHGYMVIKNKIVSICAIGLVLAIIGYQAGRLAGGRMLAGILMKESSFPFLLSKPVSQFYNMYVLLNSGNPFNRISGYYSLLDNNMIDEEFLLDRYRKEELFAIKRTIVWILGFSRDTGMVLRDYAALFKEADEPMKKAILELMKRKDRAYYLGFVRDNRIDKRLEPREGREYNDYPPVR